jgi:WhiB family redox-sensing transcriptional regulator
MTNVARLPGPIADVWDWQLIGSCRGADSARFFHPDGERGASRGRREAAAKAVCATCPVRAECAAHALATREPYGVWGGFTETERLRLIATGWEDLADRRRARVDVSGLELRLGIRPTNGTPTLRAVNGSGTCTGSPSPLLAQPHRSAVPVQRHQVRRPVGAQPAG